jgi:hypothetical protein
MIYPTPAPEEPAVFDNWMKRHYIAVQKHRIIYCPIEKNACTYFKRLLLEQSEVAQEYRESGLESHTFINQRQKLLLSDLRQLRDETYLRFVIVREPIERVVSAYLNKFVLNQNFRWAIDAAEKYAAIDPSFQEIDQSLSFRQFVQMLAAYPDDQLDLHWRPQSAFFDPVVGCFDYIVPMESISQFVNVLETRCNTTFSRQKTRNQNQYQFYANHGVGANDSLSDQPMCDWKPADLRTLNPYPDPQTLVVSEIREQLLKRYARDIELYQIARDRFPESGSQS